MTKGTDQIVETIQESGVRKTSLEPSKLLVLGFLAGAYVGFGAQIATTVSIDAAQYLGVGAAKVLVGTVFSVGLMLVILGGAELFTGNCLISLSVLGGKVKLAMLAYNWSIV